jgi:hypothetical protein
MVKGRTLKFGVGKKNVPKTGRENCTVNIFLWIALSSGLAAIRVVETLSRGESLPYLDPAPVIDKLRVYSNFSLEG